MYIERAEVHVAAGHIAEFEERVHRSLSLFNEQAGFIGGLYSRSLGQPNRFRGMFRWGSREDAWAFRSSKVWSEQAPATSGAVTPVRPFEAYELVHEVGTGAGPYAQTGDWEIAYGAKDEFEERFLKLFRLREQHNTGFGRIILYAYLGDHSHYYVVQTYDSLESLKARDKSPEVLEYIREANLGKFSTSSTVIQRWLTIARS